MRRGAPLSVLDYVRRMDQEIRDLRANAGTTRVPSQRIGDYIIEIDDSSGDPLIKMTEVATGFVTYCCIPDDETDCFEVPPFSWYGVIDEAEVFPGYPSPREVTLVEVAVVQRFQGTEIGMDIKVNDSVFFAFTTTAALIATYQIDPPITLFPNDVITIQITNVGSGEAEDLTIVLRSCSTEPELEPM